MPLTPTPILATLRVETELVQANHDAKVVRDKRSPAAAQAHHRINQLLDVWERLDAEAQS